MSEDRIDHEPWPLRAVILLVLGAAMGLAFHFLISNGGWSWTEDPLRIAGACFVAISGLTFAFTLEKIRWTWPPVFAIGCGLIAAGIVYWNGGPEGWRFGCLLLGVAIAAPLFQVVRDEGRWNPVQRSLHAHAWSNVVLWCAAWLFVLIFYLLAQLLAELFALIGIDILRTLLNKDWANWMLIGGALGAAVGLLRDRDKVLGLLQRVVTVVLSMLAPVIALGLALFVLSLPFTGLGPLWRETSQTTPILLACAIVAFFFVIATIGNSVEEEPRHPVLRYAAIVLAIVILPLAVIAAVSTGMRIGQYGFTPDRLWAATFILVVLAFGLAYLAAIVLGRATWPDRIRRTNVWLAIGLCGLAILLATPIVNFYAISTNDQVGKLVSGKITPDRFDWRALAFDFGPSGRKALERLQREGATPLIRSEAVRALAFKSRWNAPAPGEQVRRREELAQTRILPRQIKLPPKLEEKLLDEFMCSVDRPCTVVYGEGADLALIISKPSCVQTTALPDGNKQVTAIESAGGGRGACTADTTLFYRKGDAWLDESEMEESSLSKAQEQTISRLVGQGWQKGEIEIREVKRRQAFIGGEPVGDTFE